MDKKKKKKSQKPNDKAMPKNTKKNSKLNPFVIVLLIAVVILGCGGGAVAILQSSAEQSALTLQQNRQSELVGKAAEALLNQHFNTLDQQAKSVSKDNPQLLTALTEFMAAFKAKEQAALKPVITDTETGEDTAAQAPATPEPLSILENADKTLMKEFPGAMSARLLPWTYSGSAGLKNQGIKLRNNIEIHLFANAGEDESEAPKAYQVEKDWLVSMAYPIFDEKEVKGVLLLTYSMNSIKALLNAEFLNQFSKIELLQGTKNKKVFTVGKGGSGEAQTFTSPIAQTKLSVTSKVPAAAPIQNTFITVYTVLIAVAVAAAIACLVVYAVIASALKKDATAIAQYLPRLAGLHKPDQPALSFKVLKAALDEADKLGERISKNALSGDKVAADHSDAVSNSEQSATFSGVADGAMVEEVAEPATPDFMHLFRDYDIRGIADEIDNTLATQIGQALGSEALARGLKTMAVAGDCRLSTPRLKTALIKGLTLSGIDVVDVGLVPSPILYFATHNLNTQAGVMVTGSHNPKDHNGFKMLIGGQSLHGEAIQALAQRIVNKDFNTPAAEGQVSSTDVSEAYVDEICTDVIAANPMKIVVDGGNGTGGDVACRILEQLDCEVVPLYCDMDGNFPNHSPDPCNPDNLADLIKAVADNGADMGIAFDGDADRVVAVTHDGRIIEGDQLMMIFAADVVSRNPASTVVYDIKCSRHLNKVITENGGRPVLWKTGHSNIKAKMQETEALLGGEYTGHFCFKERWYGFDDGIYSAMRLIELLTMDDRSLAERVDALPKVVATPEMVLDVASDNEKFTIMEQLSSTLAQTDGNLIDIDGIRIEFNDGWGLVRASNTGAKLTARFEGDSDESLARIKAIFSQALAAINPNLSLP